MLHFFTRDWKKNNKNNFRVLKELYQAQSFCKKLAADDDAYLGWDWSKI